MTVTAVAILVIAAAAAAFVLAVVLRRPQRAGGGTADVTASGAALSPAAEASAQATQPQPAEPAAARASRLRLIAEHHVSLAGGPRTVRLVPDLDGALILLAAVTEQTRRVGQNVLAYRLAPNGSAAPLGAAGAASVDIGVPPCGPAEAIVFDPGPPLEQAGVKCYGLADGAWRVQGVDISRGMSCRTGMSCDRSGDVLWASYVEAQGLLWVARRENGSWTTFPLGKGRGRVGEQTSIVARSADRATIVSQRRQTEWTSGDTVIGSFQALDMQSGLKDDVRAAMSASSSKDIVITTVMADGSQEEAVLATVDMAHTPALGSDASGRLLCATLHADNPPDLTRFRIRLATRADEGWLKEDVATFEDDAPFHLKILRDGSGRLFGGQPFLVAFKAMLGENPVRIQPVVLWKEPGGWTSHELPAVEFDDEQCAHYHPVADTVAADGYVHIAVPAMRQGRPGTVRRFMLAAA